MTRSRLRSAIVRLLPLLGIIAVALLVAACAGRGSPAGSPGGSGVPPPSLPPAAIPLEPAKFGLDPVCLIAWLFTPLFQTFFILLVLLDKLTGNIAIAIILLTVGPPGAADAVLSDARSCRRGGCSCSARSSRRSRSATRATG